MPIPLVLSSETNLQNSVLPSAKPKIDEYLRNLRLGLLSEHLVFGDDFNLEEVMVKGAPLFHICQNCLKSTKGPYLVEKLEVSGTDQLYIRIRFSCKTLLTNLDLSDLHEFWINSKSSPRIANETQPYPPIKINREVERVIAWHRPIFIAPKNHLDMYILIKEKDPKSITFGTSRSIYFLVKWKDRDYNQATWEDEFLLKSNYQKVIQFAARKAEEYFKKKGISQYPVPLI